MPIDLSVTRRTWFWPALLVAAIVAGAIVQWVREPGAPAPVTPPANVTAPPVAVPGSAKPSPGVPALTRPPMEPERPPLIHAEVPRAHPPPGTEPPVPLTANRALDPHVVLDDSARRWADSVRGVRPEILEQMRLGKMQERERLQQDMRKVGEGLLANPGNAALQKQLESIQNNLFYLDRSMTYLQDIEAEPR
jgi:hypothetical protein